MRPDWDRTWMDVARVIAQRSRCSRAKVGAVVVDDRNRIIATGYNSPAAGWRPPCMSDELPKDYFDDCKHWCKRAQLGPQSDDYRECPSTHAEANCLLFVDRRYAEGGSLYVTGDVCIMCAHLVANCGVARVVVKRDKTDRSYRDSELGYDLLRDSGLVVVTL